MSEHVFGIIEAPEGVVKYANLDGGIGLIGFISNLIKVGTLVAGLWVLYNFIKAGFILLKSGGDTSAYGKVSQELTMSVVGLVVIVAAYAITGVVSLIVFGDAGYILNPTISGPGDSLQ